MLDNTGNNSLGARESGKLRFALINNGNSPSKNIKASIKPLITSNIVNFCRERDNRNRRKKCQTK